jgi:hypothetical protein
MSESQPTTTISFYAVAANLVNPSAGGKSVIQVNHVLATSEAQAKAWFVDLLHLQFPDFAVTAPTVQRLGSAILADALGRVTPDAPLPAPSVDATSPTEPSPVELPAPSPSPDPAPAADPNQAPAPVAAKGGKASMPRRLRGVAETVLPKTPGKTPKGKGSRLN